MDSIQKLLPYLAICEWQDADTEKILRDLIISKEKNLTAISVSGNMQTVANSLSDGKITVFGFGNNTESKSKKNMQIFIEKSKLESLDLEPDTILAFSLREIEHLDWSNIIRIPVAGFLFIDNGGKFLHRFYDFLNLISDKWTGILQYCAGTNDIEKVADAYSLVKKLRPNLLANFKIFVESNFFINRKPEQS